MNCPKCGKEMEKGAIFCSACGTSIKNVEERKIYDIVGNMVSNNAIISSVYGESVEDKQENLYGLQNENKVNISKLDNINDCIDNSVNNQVSQMEELKMDESEKPVNDIKMENTETTQKNVSLKKKESKMQEDAQYEDIIEQEMMSQNNSVDEQKISVHDINMSTVGNLAVREVYVNNKRTSTEGNMNSNNYTFEFEERDISENKVMAMIAYIGGLLGIIIALIGGKDSRYVSFHVKQALKLNICLMLIMTLIVPCSILVNIPVLGIISSLVVMILVTLLIVVMILNIVAFFQVCEGKAKEPFFVGGLNIFK